MEYRLRTIERDLEFLKQKSEPVSLEDPKLSEYIDALEKYCGEHELFALASIQLGIAKRIIYVKHSKEFDEEVDENERKIYLNPVITKRFGLTSYWEACASCLDNMGYVLRPYQIEVEYEDLNGNKKVDTFQDFEATVFSHEYDHLEGILHLDIALEVKNMPVDERKKFRKTHPYQIMDKTHSYAQLCAQFQKDLEK